ncbi:unnamed protein product [Gadus morhua 'NCC']
MLCQQVEALKNEVHDLKHNSSGNLGSPHHQMYGDSYGADGLQEPYTPVPSFQAPQLTDATTGQSGYYNQSYNSQYPPRTSANVTPTKGSMYTMNRMPPQPHMYSYQQPNHTPPMQPALPCVYPPQEQVFGVKKTIRNRWSTSRNSSCPNHRVSELCVWLEFRKPIWDEGRSMGL